MNSELSRFRHELLLNARYAIAGVFNTLVGLAAIWAFTLLGLVPILANFLGYMLGLTVSFCTSKKFIFKSHGHISKEGLQFACAFLLSYCLNLAVLYACQTWASVHLMTNQTVAVLSYTICMYLLQRFVVFTNRESQTH